MLKAPSAFIIVFIAVSVILILAMAIFISVIIYRYQQRQNIYFKDMEALKSSHENTLLQSQLEMQEDTFQTISREIHDNIGQKLTLAKLYLNTLDFHDIPKLRLQINDSVDIIGGCITELTDLSRSLSSEIIVNNGLINALEYETTQLSKSGLYLINYSVTGNPVFVDTNTGLVVFRVVQEALNNIVKHAAATVIDINLHYADNLLIVQINDNGRGFNIAETRHGTGLLNIKKRAMLLKGNVTISSSIGSGTKLEIEIPWK
jgi:signal transduction histidine kinase